MIRDNKLRGAVLFGDASDASWYFEHDRAAGVTSGRCAMTLLFGPARIIQRQSAPRVPTAESAAGCFATGATARVEIAGDPRHPANFGRLCSKGTALGETLGPEDRLLYPSIHGQRASWDDALKNVASGFTRIIREHGPDAVAFYVSGQLLTEDYYVANKLMKGFIGTANIDTNSRLCMSSAVAGHSRAFGEDLVPGCYEDFELADLIVLVGSNSAWCHPVLYQRIAAREGARPDLQIVVLDPRRTPTCEIADLHLPLRAGSDVVAVRRTAGVPPSQRTHGCEVRRSTHGRLATHARRCTGKCGDLGVVAAACGVDVER